MVPHGAIEEVLLKGHDDHHLTLVVTSLSDERKGERLVVLYTAEAGCSEALSQWLNDSDLPNLWKPHTKAFYQVESIPLLGSGKLDLQEIRRLAEQEAMRNP